MRLGVLVGLVVGMVGGFLPTVPASLRGGGSEIAREAVPGNGLAAAMADGACGPDLEFREFAASDGDGLGLDPAPDLGPVEETREWSFSVCVDTDGGWDYAPGGDPVQVVRGESAAAEVDLMAAALNQSFGAPVTHTTPEITILDGHPFYVGLETWIEVDEASWNMSPTVPDPVAGVSVDVVIEPLQVKWEFGEESGSCPTRGALPPTGLGADFDLEAPCGVTPERVSDGSDLRVWVEYRITVTGSLTGATESVVVSSPVFSRAVRVDEVQAFGVSPEEGVEIPAPGDRSYGDDSDCSLNPFTWDDCARDAVETVVRVVVAGGRLIVEAGKFIYEGYEFVYNTAWEITEAIANGLVEGLDVLRRLAGGCLDAIGDKFTEIADALVTVWDFVKNPVAFIEEKIGEVKALIEAAMADLSGTALEAVKGVIEWELLVTDPIEWIGKVGCSFLIEALTGTLATTFTKYLDEVLPDRPGRDRGDDGDGGDGDGDSNGDGDSDGDGDDGGDGDIDCPVDSFPTGTPVLLASGAHRAIDLIEPGDRVLAYNTVTERWSPRTVLKQWSHLDTDEMATITLADGSTIQATDHHPFWVDSQGRWVHAENVRRGDLLLTPTGVTPVASVDVEPTTGTLVWELTVEIDHTFTVSTGSQDLLVHNCRLEPRPRPDDLTDGELQASQLLEDRGDTILGEGEQVKQLLGIEDGPHADIVSQTEGGRFNVTEVKESYGTSGADVGHAVEQLDATVDALKDKVPGAKIGELSIAVPESGVLRAPYAVSGDQLVTVIDGVTTPVRVDGNVVHVVRLPGGA